MVYTRILAEPAPTGCKPLVHWDAWGHREAKPLLLRPSLRSEIQHLKGQGRPALSNFSGTIVLSCPWGLDLETQFTLYSNGRIVAMERGNLRPVEKPLLVGNLGWSYYECDIASVSWDGLSGKQGISDVTVVQNLKTMPKPEATSVTIPSEAFVVYSML
ncbi:hypothetical protein NMY22_g19298 [Coprinellus aureogranulatus]|nr:hypothetical protein NMY22_g19298 [Coprinellus aureogranulatus]